jgi:hypothetical protein
VLPQQYKRKPVSRATHVVVLTAPGNDMRLIAICALAGLALYCGAATADARHPSIVVAAAPQARGAPADEKGEKKLSPTDKMNRRFPQPVRVGFLIGLPMLDWRDSTIGFIRQVVRTPDGKIKLIVPYGRWFPWIGYGGVFDWGRRPVAVPIETVAILAGQVAALDMAREEFDAAPRFVMSESAALAVDETIQIAITRR